MTARFLTTALLVCLGSALLPAEPQMASIPAGEFTMGRTRETPDDKTNMRPMVLRDDRPAHKIYLDAFEIDTREVTQSDYAAFVKSTGHRPPYHWKAGKIPEGAEQFPVYNVAWEDANAYCGWAGKRLPTEAEWEKAARGGLEGLDYPLGDKITPADARFNVADGPAPVGKFQPNAYGLFDMAGGVAEWVNDWFDAKYYEASPAKNPTGPGTAKYKAVRGGAWSDGPRRITVFFRNWVRPSQTTPNLGFRCARSLPH
jgi:formylglycine-generating enzyme required for sulfatase activity